MSTATTPTTPDAPYASALGGTDRKASHNALEKARREAFNLCKFEPFVIYI